MKAIQTTPMLRRRLRPLLAANFLQSFVLWYAIEKLFMKSIGFNNETIALETIIFTSVMLITNLPLGILADRWSRRGVLMIAGLMLCLASLICGLSQSVGWYIFGICFWGLFSASYSGTYDSVVYDTVLEETGSTKAYTYYYGRIKLLSSSALILSSLISGVLAKYTSLQADYLLSVPLALCSLIPLAYFREPLSHKKEVNKLLAGHIRQIFAAVLHRRDLFWVLTCLVFAQIGISILFEFGPLWYVALALPVILYGPLVALLQSSVGLSGFIAGRLGKNWQIMTIAIMALLGSLALTLRSAPLIALALTAVLTGLVAISIIFSKNLHDAMPSAIRASSSSLVTTIGYLLFLPTAFWFGRTSRIIDIFSAAWIVVGITAIILIGVSKTLYKQLSTTET